MCADKGYKKSYTLGYLESIYTLSVYITFYSKNWETIFIIIIINIIDIMIIFIIINDTMINIMRWKPENEPVDDVEQDKS